MTCPSIVQVELRGEELRGSAHSIDGRQEPTTAEEGLRAYAARFPGAARRLGVRFGAGGVDDATMRQVAGRSLLVRIVVPAEALERARAATVVPGRGIVATIRRHPLGSFFALTFAISWGYWIPAAIEGGHLSHFPGLLGPMLSAFAITGISLGRRGSMDLLARMFRWRVPLRWYAAAAAPLLAGILAIGGLALGGRDVPSLRALSRMPGLPSVSWLGVLILTLVVNGFGEETGWRGFAWTHLRRRHGLAGAALLLAIPWAVWHIPTFFLDTGMRGFEPLMVPGFLVGMAAGAVVLGWVYERAGDSILIVAPLHAFLNMGSAPPGTEGVIQVTVTTFIILWAVYILRRSDAGGRRALRMGATWPSARHHTDPYACVGDEEKEHEIHGVRCDDEEGDHRSMDDSLQRDCRDDGALRRERRAGSRR